MKTLPLNEVSRVVEEWKKGFLKARTLKSEITIKSNCNQARYRLMFKRTNRWDLGKFYLMSSDQSFQLHDLVLHSLLVNIKRGNYDILSAFSIFENGLFEESDQISIQSNNQKGEIKIMTKNTPAKEKPLTQVEAVTMANEILRLEATVKEMKNQLKDYVEEYGSVETNDQVWDFNESVSWNFPGDKLKEIMTMIALDGYNPWDMISLSKRSLDKLGWNDDILKQYGEKKVIKRFASKKK